MGRRATWPPRVLTHRASGRDFVRVAGRDHYLGKAGSPESRAAYVALVARLEAEGAAPPGGAAPGPAGPTVASVVQAWRVWALKRFGAEASEPREYDYAVAPGLELFAALPAAAFDAQHLERVRDLMVEQGLSRRVANRRVNRWRTLWRWAERRGLAPRGSWANLRSLPALAPGEQGVRERPPVAPVSWRDVAAACRQAGPTVRGLVLAGWFTGARPGELFGLRCGELATPPGVREMQVALPRHKNAWRGHQRVLWFGPKALAALRSLLAGRDADDLVFPNRDGLPHNRNSYWLALSRACRRAGVHFHPYQLRHAAKLRIARELGLDHARAVLGQACVATTDRYAAGPDPRLAVEAARRCG